MSKEDSKELALIIEEAKKADKKFKESIKEDIKEQSVDDYEFARATTYDTLEKLSSLLDSAVTVAEETEAPGAIKAAQDLGKTIIENANLLTQQQEKLLDLVEKVDMLADSIYCEERPAIEDKNKSFTPNSSQTQNISSSGNSEGQVNVSMTTSDFLDMLDKVEEDRKQPIDITPSSEEPK